MGLFVSERARRDGRVTVVQLLGAIVAFVVLSVIGGVLLAGLALPAVTVAGNAAEGTSDLFEELPGELEDVTLPQQSRIWDRTGENLIATFYSQNRVVVPLEEISPWLQKAVVAVEDKRFWEHNGVDGEGILRAVYITYVAGDDTAGGSTLTQQLVKNTLLQKAIEADDTDAIEAATEATVERKIREWRLALAYEEQVNSVYGTQCTDAPEVDCGKEQVLEQYLNIAQFGLNTYGVEAAAQYYFSKPASEINALEAATIAGITQNPSKWDPVRYPENAKIRRDIVLGVMHDQGMITQAELNEYKALTVEETLNVSYPKFSCRASDLAPFFCDYVTKVIRQDEAFKGEGFDLLYSGGLDIITTLDVTKQQIANEELVRSLPMDDPSGWAMALVSLESSTGQILAMSQTREFDPANEAPNSTSINYSTDRDYGGSRGFSPGSTFKPVILSTWLDSGRSLNQIVSGGIREYDPSDWTASCLGSNPYSGKPWKPTNVLGSGGSAMTVLNATANSINTAYVAMANQLDLCDIKTMAETLGFHRADGKEIEIVPSISLGTQNASPLTMASVMQTFANNGARCEPYAILSITDAEGNVPVDSNGDEIILPGQNCNQVISEELATGVQYAMTKVIEYGTGEDLKLAGGRMAAGKTGTSQNNAHLWFTGYTPQLTTAVWLGNPNQDTPGQRITLNGQYYRYVYGGTISGPTWQRFMNRALEGQPNLPMATTASSNILNGVPREVPSIVGLTEAEAKRELTDAGFRSTASVIYSDAYAPGTVAAQYPSAGDKATPGSAVTYYLATNQLPHWYTNWPAGWDPNVAPEDWWGATWPPPEFATNPPNNWPPAEEEPDPDPSTDPGDGGGGGGAGGGGGPGGGG